MNLKLLTNQFFNLPQIKSIQVSSKSKTCILEEINQKPETAFIIIFPLSQFFSLFDLAFCHSVVSSLIHPAEFFRSPWLSVRSKFVKYAEYSKTHRHRMMVTNERQCNEIRAHFLSQRGWKLIGCVTCSVACGEGSNYILRSGFWARCGKYATLYVPWLVDQLNRGVRLKHIEVTD